MKTKDIAVIGMLIAASFMLGQIKIMGSIALDSAPSFLALFLLKDYKAAIIAPAGTLLSAATAGFAPAGLPITLVVAALMSVMMLIGKVLINKTNMLLTVGFLIMFNSFVIPLAMFLSGGGTPAYLGVIPALCAATAANIGLAILAYPLLHRSMNNVA